MNIKPNRKTIAPSVVHRGNGWNAPRLLNLFLSFCWSESTFHSCSQQYTIHLEYENSKNSLILSGRWYEIVNSPNKTNSWNTEPSRLCIRWEIAVARWKWRASVWSCSKDDCRVNVDRRIEWMWSWSEKWISIREERRTASASIKCIEKIVSVKLLIFNIHLGKGEDKGHYQLSGTSQ